MPLMAMVSVIIHWRGRNPSRCRNARSTSCCCSSTMSHELDDRGRARSLNRVGRTVVATNNQMMLKPLIRSGEGVAFFTPLGLLRRLEAGESSHSDCGFAIARSAGLGIVVPRRRQLTQATEVVIESMSVELKKFGDKIQTVIQR